MPSEPQNVLRKSSENRRTNKPIMEKRRRARINNCLNELKNLILDATKKDPARHSKLEKADILEMTVKHLQTVHRHQVALNIAANPTIVSKYRAGFNECANEVSRFLGRSDDVDIMMKQRLLGHLAACLAGLNQQSVSVPQAQQQKPEVQNTFPFVPTRLPSGEIAFVLSQNVATQGQYQRPCSSASSNSLLEQDKPLALTMNSRGCSQSPISSIGSPVPHSPYGSDYAMDYKLHNLHPYSRPLSHSPQPLSLVKDSSEEVKTWRPW
ncbi:hypothetical protein QYM36_016492 [Artemia franciscana]|uniref:Uncharacterized protein n=2 Tax=Artemia franciscana TaxID=6661 RepID=A0AA88KY68_ARTSF|nr:hypothetical protein QYM36_016492 [Artemia franciscana]